MTKFICYIKDVSEALHYSADQIHKGFVPLSLSQVAINALYYRHMPTFDHLLHELIHQAVAIGGMHTLGKILDHHYDTLVQNGVCELVGVSIEGMEAIA